MLWRNVYRRPSWPRRIRWQEMRDLQEEMDFRLGGTFGPVRTKYPAINGWNSDEGILITAEIPGLEADDIDISIVGETLILSGSRNVDELPEGADYYRRERGYGEFTRTFELPFRVDVEAVDARFQNGVLQLELPRLPEEKPRKIEITID